MCNDIDSIVLTTNSVLQDFEQDGVVYLELRTTPRAIPSAGLDKEAYVTTILGCIRDFNKKSHTMTASLILSIDRRNDLETAMDVVRLASLYRDRGVVGIDLVKYIDSALLPLIPVTDVHLSAVIHLKEQSHHSHQLSNSPMKEKSRLRYTLQRYQQ